MTRETPPSEHFPTAGGPTVLGVPGVCPILAIELGRTLEESKAAGVVGTGFQLGSDVLVTCWHCVQNENYNYVVSRGEVKGESGRSVVYSLDDVAQDANGSDLATAKIDEDPTIDTAMQLRLSDVAAAASSGVWTYGFPLPRQDRSQDGTVRFIADGRILRGYLTRSFTYEHPIYGKTASYEIDMPAPEGLSGAPLMLDNQVIGVMYGENDVATIESFASIDPETEERSPDVVRLVSFALAHFTSTLHALRGPATENKPLIEYLSQGDRA